MHHDRVDADRLQQHDVLREVLGRTRIAHRVAAIFHHEGLARIALEIGERLGERLSLGEQSGVGGVVGHGERLSGPAAALKPDRACGQAR